MTAYLVERTRDRQKKWMERLADDERARDIRCAQCNGSAAVTPMESRLCDTGVVERTWHCAACGNHWTTWTRVHHDGT
jgi:purine nucleoside permease